MEPPAEEPGPFARRAELLVALALVVTALYVWLGPLLGADPEDQARSQRVTLAILCLLAAYQWLQLRRTRRALARTEDLLQDVLFGAGTKRDRDAVDILVQALRSPDARGRETALRTLRKISGMDLGDEAGAWEQWWAVARSTFTRPGPAAKK
jgi:hypothetical protein